MSSIHILAVIPARLASTRLPRKVLREIAGKPMLQWIVEAALASPKLDRVVVATDSDEVMALAAKRGWEAMLTSPDLQSGSDRVHAVSQQIPSEIVVNIQGDEPMLRPEHIDALLAPFDRAGDRRAGDNAMDAMHPRRNCRPQRREGRAGRRWPGALLFALDNSFRPGPFRRHRSTASTSASMPTAALHWSASPRCRRIHSKQRSGSSNCDCSRTTFRSTWSRRRTRPSALTTEEDLKRVAAILASNR